MEKKIVLFLPKNLITDEKRELLETLIRYVKNDDSDIEIYLKEKIKNCISEKDIVELSNFINNPKVSRFISLNNKQNKILNKIRILLSSLYIFKIIETDENDENISEEKGKIRMHEYVEGVYVFFSNHESMSYNVDNVYNELYKDMVNSKDIEDKAFLSNMISNLNILRKK